MDLLECDLPGIKKLRSGKVREVFDLGGDLLVVATDRISAFDCILPNAIPRKGEVLTQMSAYWFETLDFVPNHFITANFASFPGVLQPFEAELAGRSMLVRKVRPLPVECVVRGYLAGSGWKEYQESGSVCGQELPRGLLQASRLPETLFTPTTKAETGHDENIAWRKCRALLGDDLAHEVRARTIELYEYGRAKAAAAGIIVADTKFEFGVADDELLLIDECLTPDSSRFWAEEFCQPGGSPPSYDKQFVRDYLETVAWDKSPPAPPLPAEVVRRTSDKYIEAFEKLTGRRLLPA
ncbi:MAG: phosphoribosylaminoimidazolesuccinocarboxamide synthase [Terrimicrobiaceae bacterium]|jgi:phosphoribosylaminoimidazole-succinocarboxamide synthase|nr:phosphoribosylaminoimidazolesuccinocarboxamide synthase [Terrimicrobiaceae bacterium]